MRGIEPEKIHTYSVEVNGRHYPVKHVFRVITGIPDVEFDSQQARRHPPKPGFVLHEDGLPTS
jgi:hypothetical protein